MKICLVCSSGGHLIEMKRLRKAFQSHETFLITYKEEFSTCYNKIKKLYLIKNFLVNNIEANFLKKNFLVFLQLLLIGIYELKIFLKEKPDVVVSTGSEIAIPIFYLAKIFRKKIIFIESLCRIKSISNTGKIVYPITDLFLVQWSSLQKKYNKAIFEGNTLFLECKIKKKPKGNYILVTVGTAPFPRLIKKMDEIAGNINRPIIMQIGNTDYKPKNTEYFAFQDFSKMVELTENAYAVVSHAGVGTILTTFQSGKNIILVPRSKRLKETNSDNHQLEICKELEHSYNVNVIYDLKDLENELKKLNSIEFKKTKENSDIIRYLSNYLKGK